MPSPLCTWNQCANVQQWMVGMLIQNPREYLRYAYEQHFAMPAFNVCNMEMAKAVIEAAVIEKAPVIVQTYPGDLAHAAFGSDVGPLPVLIRAMAQEAPVPVIMHLDHGPGFEFNLRCLRAGYNSVMYDGHDLPLDAALAETALIARAAHALNASVEGELGTFGGGQGSFDLTNPDDVPLMFEQGVDMLAVSVGSEHGQASRLDMELLKAIAAKAQAPLVIHGGSGVHEDDVRAALNYGVVKINIGAALARAWCAGSREALENGCNDHYLVLKLSMDRVREVAQHRLRLMGAAGRAA